LRVLSFIDSLYANEEFLTDLLRFHKKISYFGAVSSLSQVVLKITSPGIPDFYRGTEVWDFSLADPDNRRPVDFASRIQILEQLKTHANPRKLLKDRSEEHTSELQSRFDLVCRLLLEKKKKIKCKTYN